MKEFLLILGGAMLTGAAFSWKPRSIRDEDRAWVTATCVGVAVIALVTAGSIS